MFSDLYIRTMVNRVLPTVPVGSACRSLVKSTEFKFRIIDTVLTKLAKSLEISIVLLFFSGSKNCYFVKKLHCVRTVMSTFKLLT